MNRPRPRRDEQVTMPRMVRGSPRLEDPTMFDLKPLSAFRRWMRYRSNLKVLEQLDDRTLRDIGLYRSEIGIVARRNAA
jgi:uncharacterized protein YjiS (DUF1127 family)